MRAIVFTLSVVALAVAMSACLTPQYWQAHFVPKIDPATVTGEGFEISGAKYLGLAPDTRDILSGDNSGFDLNMDRPEKYMALFEMDIVNTGGDDLFIAYSKSSLVLGGASFRLVGVTGRSAVNDRDQIILPGTRFHAVMTADLGEGPSLGTMVEYSDPAGLEENRSMAEKKAQDMAASMSSKIRTGELMLRLTRGGKESTVRLPLVKDKPKVLLISPLN